MKKEMTVQEALVELLGQPLAEKVNRQHKIEALKNKEDELMKNIDSLNFEVVNIRRRIAFLEAK